MRAALWIATTLETLVRGPLLDSQQDKNIYLKKCSAHAWIKIQAVSYAFIKIKISPFQSFPVICIQSATVI